MVLELLKVIWAQSGKLYAVPSFQPPLLPQLTPARSLSLRPAGPKAALKEEDTLATPPLLASATLNCVGGPAFTPQASISVRREKLLRPLVTLMRMRSVVVGAKLTVRLTRLLPLTVPKVIQLAPSQPWTVKSVTP